MKIERFYYSDSKALEKMIEKQIEEEKQKMTEQERIQDKEQKLREAQAIMEKGNAMTNAMLKHIDQEKVKYFETMVQKALRVAEGMTLDVKIDSESGYMGTIEFTGEIIMVDGYLDKRVVREFRELMCSTEEIVVVPKNTQKVQISLYYMFAESL